MKTLSICFFMWLASAGILKAQLANPGPIYAGNFQGNGTGLTNMDTALPGSINNDLTPWMFGTVNGNGTGDDTATLQAMLNFAANSANTNANYIVKLAPGTTYNCLGSLFITNTVWIYGTSPQWAGGIGSKPNPLIQFHGTNGIRAITSFGSHHQVNDIHIEGVSVTGDLTAGGVGMEFVDTTGNGPFQGFHLNNFTINNFDRGLVITNAAQCVLENGMIVNCTNGMVLSQFPGQVFDCQIYTVQANIYGGLNGGLNNPKDYAFQFYGLQISIYNSGAATTGARGGGCYYNNCRGAQYNSGGELSGTEYLLMVDGGSMTVQGGNYGVTASTPAVELTNNASLTLVDNPLLGADANGVAIQSYNSAIGTIDPVVALGPMRAKIWNAAGSARTNFVTIIPLDYGSSSHSNPSASTDNSFDWFSDASAFWSYPEFFYNYNGNHFRANMAEFDELFNRTNLAGFIYSNADLTLGTITDAKRTLNIGCTTNSSGSDRTAKGLVANTQKYFEIMSSSFAGTSYDTTFANYLDQGSGGIEQFGGPNPLFGGGSGVVFYRFYVGGNLDWTIATDGSLNNGNGSFNVSQAGTLNSANINATTGQFSGNGAGLTNMSFMTPTNFISGQWYTNASGKNQFIRATCIMTLAAVVGQAGMQLWCSNAIAPVPIGTVSQPTTASTGTTPAYHEMTGVVTNKQVYTFTNQSSGLGNSAALVPGSGQILTIP